MNKEFKQIIKEITFNTYKVFYFDLELIKNSIKYKTINKYLVKKINKKKNLIICSAKKISNREILYKVTYIFDCYVKFHNFLPTISMFEKLLKKFKSNQYEISNIYEIYSYNLLKYIKKTNNYANFLQLFIGFKKINIIKNLKKLVVKTEKKSLGAIFNKNLLAFFCENGVNYFLLNKQEITQFSYNLIKKNNFEICMGSENLLENGNYTFYKNIIIVSKNNNYAIIKLSGNILSIQVKSNQNNNIKIYFDKYCEPTKKASKFIININDEKCEISTENKNVKLINTQHNFGYEKIETKFMKVQLIFNKVSNEIINYAETMEQIEEYYKCSNNLMNINELNQLINLDINYPIKNLPALSYLYPQCNNSNIVSTNLNFNSRTIIPNKNLVHLFCDGKAYNINNIINNECAILTRNVSEIYFDICSYNFSFKKNGNCIKIFHPLVSQNYFINSSNKVQEVKKIFNFIRISFINKNDSIIVISSENKKIAFNNPIKDAMKFKHNALKQINFDFSLPQFNLNLFINRCNQINYFSEEFAILHQKINEKCIFLPFFSSFQHKNAVLDLFLNYSDWKNKHHKMVVDYIYKLGEYSVSDVVKNNLKIINSQCLNKDLKQLITDQYGQISNTIIDEFYFGNFNLAETIPNFYFCYVYIQYMLNVKNHKNINFLKAIEKIKLFESKKIITINNSSAINIKNVNYLGFNKIESDGNIFINF